MARKRAVLGVAGILVLCLGRARAFAPNVAGTRTGTVLAMGQPGGRTGCCWKAASYLEKAELQRQPAEAAKAMDELVAKLGTSTLKENLAVIEEYCSYSPVAFSCGAVENAADANQASAKLLSLGLLLDLDDKVALDLWGEVWREVKGTEGTNHGNIREFEKAGFAGVDFPDGLAITWK